MANVMSVMPIRGSTDLRTFLGWDPESAPALALRQGAVSGLSFGYRARAFHRDRQGRELIDIDLFEQTAILIKWGNEIILMTSS